MKAVKAQLREAILHQLKTQDRDAYQRHGERIVQQIADKLNQMNASIICAYLPMPHELPVDAAFEQWIQDGRTIYVPQQATIGQGLTWTRWTADQKWKTDRWGIRVPIDAKGCELPDCSEVDAVIVPAVAYGQQGERLGYGGGFYDRFIKLLRDHAGNKKWSNDHPQSKKCMFIGAGYSLQFQSNIPREAHDQCVDWLIHEQASFPAEQ